MTYKLYSKKDGKPTAGVFRGRQVHWKVRKPPRSLGGGLLPNAFQHRKRRAMQGLIGAYADFEVSVRQSLT